MRGGHSAALYATFSGWCGEAYPQIQDRFMASPAARFTKSTLWRLCASHIRTHCLAALCVTLPRLWNFTDALRR